MSQVPLPFPGRVADAEPTGLVGHRLAAGVPGLEGTSMWVLDVGLACCAVEFVSATLGSTALRVEVDAVADGADELRVMVVSGTVTDKAAPGVRALYDRLPEPKRVISFGSCANSGGPYWDSYCVTKGVDQIIPVDVYVPGCPPRPEALLDGLRTLGRLVDAKPASS
jgi:NADH-quinone oxidoreductase subunit B